MEEIKCMVQFTPRAEDKFRVSVSPSRLWLENHKTKHQWQCKVSSTDDFAVSQGGMPGEIVMKLLATSLQNTAAGISSDECRVELKRRKGSDLMDLDLVLKFDIAGFAWCAQYKFPMDPLEVSEMQILSAQMLDIQDDIESLRKSVASIQLERTSAMPAIDRVLLSSCVFISDSMWNSFGKVHQAMERVFVKVKSVS